MSEEQVGVTLPGAPAGMTTVDRVEEMIQVARKFNVNTLKISGAQRLRLYIDADKAPELCEALGGKMPKPVGVKFGAHSVQACPGESSCKFALADTLGMGAKLEELALNHVFPGKVKVAVSGCARNCAESYVRDIGVFAKKSGWTFIFGGNAGSRPRIGDVIAEGLSDEELLETVEKIMAAYAKEGKKMERCARFIDRVGTQGIAEICK